MTRVKSGKRDILSIEDFKSLDDLGLPLPQLILGIEVNAKSFGSDYPPRSYRFRPGRQWLNITHQVAGHGYKQRYVIGTPLVPTPAAKLGMSRLCSEWYDSDIGVGHIQFADLLLYRDNVKTWLGADCNLSYEGFAEAIYPIDVEYTSKLAADVLPNDPDELVDWESGMERASGSMNRWSLVVLGKNGVD
jgi:hypothetical protein